MVSTRAKLAFSRSPRSSFKPHVEESRSDWDDQPGGHVVTHDDERRTAFVDLELAAVWQGRERGVVTDDEIYQRLDELERLLWRRVFGRLRRVAPGSRAYVGFPTWPAGGTSRV
jgi:hypothetical protein